VRKSNFPGPLAGFLARLADAAPGDRADMGAVGRLLVDLAADEEFFAPAIADLPSGRPAGKWLIRPARGPRLLLFHRPEGVMAATHSHQCWVAIAPVRGVETHQRWDVLCHEDGRAELRLAEEHALRRGDVVTLTPPGDVHNHGHVAGSGAAPYSLILLGDEPLQSERRQFDLARGTWQVLAPGDPGRQDS
jgi:predicted metal-dependent enzyme (double-stranded beta helix superfamily)